ncbi:MAG: ABC transporter substrate-binding protein [Eggerthellaceae bacterium]|nr:ABC transporter substrate-binding protein [Eggerthellaceae bacterium]
MKRTTTIIALAFALCGVLALAGCAGNAGSQASSAASSSSDATEAAASAEVAEAADALRVVSMKGPTSVGLASMMQQEQGQFTVVAAADEIGPMLLQDQVDVACVPANVAATLYQKTDGQIRVVDVNTLGVLSVVTADSSVDSVAALEGRTVYMTGKGAVPEYTLRALLSAAGLDMEDVDVQFKSEPAEVAALLAQDATAVGILPQPYATSINLKNPSIVATVDLTQAWDELVGADGGSVVTGVTVAKASFVEENPAVIDEFLARHAASAAVAQDDPASVAQAVVDLGIIENAQLAEAAIPRCNVVCLTGADMKTALAGYLAKLYEQDPASVGGALPGDDFYYGA